MTRGKILKVRPGHEANCSSGMVAFFVLVLCSCAAPLPASFITAAAQAKALSRDEPKGWKRRRYWLVPQIVGLGLTGIIMLLLSGWDPSNKDIAWKIGVSFIIATTASYMLMPRLMPRFPRRFILAWIAPLVLVLSFMVLVNYAGVWDSYFGRPLHRAAEEGNAEKVSLLLDKGANINARDRSGWTPLHRATMQGHTKTISLLLDRGADINAREEWGTPLHWAVREGNIEVASLLLDRGADINAKDDMNGQTPLHEATSKGNAKMVSLLLDRGADINVWSKSDWTPLHSAASDGNIEIVKLLLAKGANVNLCGKEGLTPLHRAAWAGQTEMVSLLLDRGANINAKYKVYEGYKTPLGCAEELGETETAKLLRERGGRE